MGNDNSKNYRGEYCFVLRC
ncbi:Protein CBG27470 [Caenorhabditis briggsae]|uniref:Protein CBG27470 n=1 Tax=Caenorhabditis briggsae TaxID=6238 RepID=B6IK47_CAEBR|nr:Protein CBG27470 [Caenorhabditis briggsae]CAS00277.1 Protein CBG27470 [Caenorhabditis briggsae]